MSLWDRVMNIIEIVALAVALRWPCNDIDIHYIIITMAMTLYLWRFDLMRVALLGSCGLEETTTAKVKMVTILKEKGILVIHATTICRFERCSQMKCSQIVEADIVPSFRSTSPQQAWATGEYPFQQRCNSHSHPSYHIVCNSKI